MTVYLVRHASAGHRVSWSGGDLLRPLDDRGRRQADALVDQLRGREFKRIVSSPYARCVESVVPLAHARGMAVEHADGAAHVEELEEEFEELEELEAIEQETVEETNLLAEADLMTEDDAEDEDVSLDFDPEEEDSEPEEDNPDEDIK